MTTIGNPSRFAVQFELDREHGSEWLFGKLCYWCMGTRVGDYDLGTSLRDALFELESLVRPAANSRFTGMPATQVFQMLNSVLFENATDSVRDMANIEQWALHIIVPGIDVFDEWKGFALEESTTERLIFSHLPSGRIHEWILNRNEARTVINDAAAELRTLYKAQHA